jgi:hypothetical protein
LTNRRRPGKIKCIRVTSSGRRFRILSPGEAKKELASYRIYITLNIFERGGEK